MNTDDDTTGRVAVITGGGSGLGLSIASRMAEAEITTVIVGRTRERLDRACQQMLNENCIKMVSDLSVLENIPGLVQQVIERCSRIDILVNNAGIHLKAPLQEVNDQEFQKVIQANQTSVFALSREVARHMAERGSGVILNVSSMASRYGIPQVIAYTAAKSAIEGMTRAMAVELGPQGIRVNCIAPGFIHTQMSASALDQDPERKQRILQRTPLGRMGLPEEVASAALFLCSQEASFITGVILPVDGGNSIGF